MTKRSCAPRQMWFKTLDFYADPGRTWLLNATTRTKVFLTFIRTVLWGSRHLR